MSGEVAYRAREYGDGEEIVALVVGFGGGVDQLSQAARDLADTRRGAVVYEYDMGVLFDGDPEYLPRIIDEISGDFASRTSDYHQLRFGGASLGGAIGVGMQKNFADRNPEPGLYAATGTNLAELVMRQSWFRFLTASTLHRDVRRPFRSYTLDDLNEAWSEVHTPPTTAFSLALGGLDRIVPYRKMEHRVAAWKATNPGISSRRLPGLGHGGTVRWFNHHCTKLIGDTVCQQKQLLP